MNKLNSGFSRIRDVHLVTKTQDIIEALRGNTNFPTTTPSLTILSSSLLALQSALTLPKGETGEQEVAAARSTLALQLHQLARNLEMIEGVTNDMLATTGFELRKRGSRSDAPVDAPRDLRFKTTGVMGRVQLLCAPVYRAKSYEVQYALNPNRGPWTNAGTFGSTRGIMISGLVRGKDYWIRIRAIGPKGPGAWSHPATIMAT